MEKQFLDFKTLLQELRDGYPLTVDGERTIFYENGSYWEATPSGRKKISKEEAQGYLRIMVARWRRERREQRTDKGG